MKTMRITDIMADFLDSIREYEHESGEAIHFDERESSEFVDMYFNGGGKINIEESNADEENNQMKQYRLKKWYPSLPKNNKNKETLKEGSIVEVYKDDSNYFYFQFFDCCLNKLGFHYLSEEEISSDFWELIEEEESKPLFITEDGVEITDGMQSVIAIDSDINVDYTRYQWANKTHLIFGSKEGADEYILWNKPLLNLKDIDDTIEMYTHEFEELIKLARERIEK